jgi:hypothetical protein
VVENRGKSTTASKAQQATGSAGGVDDRVRLSRKESVHLIGFGGSETFKKTSLVRQEKG